MLPISSRARTPLLSLQQIGGFWSRCSGLAGVKPDDATAESGNYYIGSPDGDLIRLEAVAG
jgi:hypothetical protein